MLVATGFMPGVVPGRFADWAESRDKPARYVARGDWLYARSRAGSIYVLVWIALRQAQDGSRGKPGCHRARVPSHRMRAAGYGLRDHGLVRKL